MKEKFNVSVKILYFITFIRQLDGSCCDWLLSFLTSSDAASKIEKMCVCRWLCNAGNDYEGRRWWGKQFSTTNDFTICAEGKNECQMIWICLIYVKSKWILNIKLLDVVQILRAIGWEWLEEDGRHNSILFVIPAWLLWKYNRKDSPRNLGNFLFSISYESFASCIIPFPI